MEQLIQLLISNLPIIIGITSFVIITTVVYFKRKRSPAKFVSIRSEELIPAIPETDNRRMFDLNVETVLEHWEIYHAIREIIANAIDEQILTNTKNVNIEMEGKTIIIRDFGRGIRYEHLTQNENMEKISSDKQIVGKFGVGLKDAMATFYRHNIDIMIKSKYGDITIDKLVKHEFEEINTLHAIVSPASEPKMLGTEVILTGCKENDLKNAKDLFLKFSDETRLDITKYGEILERKPDKSSIIYINGVLVAKEENFLFSYNITLLTDAMRKSLNRERTHVGRGAYSDRVKRMLIESKSEKVQQLITDDIQKYDAGTQHDETKLQGVYKHACMLLNKTQNVLYATTDDLQHNVNLIDNAKRDGRSIVTIPNTVGQKINNLNDLSGSPIQNIDQYRKEYNKSFEFDFVKPNDLNASEKLIYDKTKDIVNLSGGSPKNIREILISNTMRESNGTDACGIWEPDTGKIIIKRNMLNSVESYAGTLLHEISHALSGAENMTLEFENELTDMIGKVSTKNPI